MRNFVFTDDKSNKFWNIELQAASFTVTFGKVGTNGQTQTKAFKDGATARKEHDKLVAEKLKKGYVETTGQSTKPAKPAAAAKSTSSEQKALEAALVEHADESTAFAAYADYLTEQGDPRGEFAQVQLALEDESRLKAERAKLRTREAALLKKHAEEWLGDAGRLLVGSWSGPAKPYHFSFRRGWLDYVRVLPVPEAVVQSIAKCPEARLLRHLEVVYDMKYHPFDFDEFMDPVNKVLGEEEASEEIYDGVSTLPALAKSPYLQNLRVLKYGFSDHEERFGHSTMVDPFGTCTTKLLEHVLKACPRLEELYLNVGITDPAKLFASPLLGNLRVFQFYFGTSEWSARASAKAYPLSALAKNKALKNITTLRFHTGRDADVVIDELDALLRSKNLPNLAHLQVCRTTFGDEAADPIVASGILKRLKTLDIGYGSLTDEGARTLAACKDLKNLDVLDVSRNALTNAGIAALKATGVNVVADAQHDGEDNEHMYSVDWE